MRAMRRCLSGQPDLAEFVREGGDPYSGGLLGMYLLHEGMSDSGNQPFSGSRYRRTRLRTINSQRGNRQPVDHAQVRRHGKSDFRGQQKCQFLLAVVPAEEKTAW